MVRKLRPCFRRCLRFAFVAERERKREREEGGGAESILNGKRRAKAQIDASFRCAVRFVAFQSLYRGTRQGHKHFDPPIAFLPETPYIPPSSIFRCVAVAVLFSFSWGSGLAEVMTLVVGYNALRALKCCCWSTRCAQLGLRG